MTQIRKPVIGITTVQEFLCRPVIQVNQSYIDMISDLGGIPVLVTRDVQVMESLHGLLIIGGQDVDPELYGQEQQVIYGAEPRLAKPYYRPADYAPNRIRDEFEMSLYQAAKSNGIPVFGICRGLQLINVAEGGTLYQEVPQGQVLHESGPDGYSQGHFIRIDLNSQAYDLMQTEHYVSSTLHHQGIDRLGENLKAVAWSQDDLIEMIEYIDQSHWVMAVQGHPERTRVNYPLYDRLIEAFIQKSQEQI